MSAAMKNDNFEGTYGQASMFVRMWAEATVAIASGDWVSFYSSDTSNPAGVVGETVRIADADNAEQWDVCGVAAEALASGTGWIQVQVRGRRTSVNVDSSASVASGDSLVIGAAVSGRAIENVFDATTTAQRRVCGICRSTPSNNTATVDIIPHPRFAA